MAEVSFLEVLLRHAAAIALTVASSLIWYLLYKHELPHRFLWKYLGAVVTGLALWRWVIVLLLRDDFFPEFNSFVYAWVQPINQAMYVLIGVSFIVMVLVDRGSRESNE